MGKGGGSVIEVLRFGEKLNGRTAAVSETPKVDDGMMADDGVAIDDGLALELRKQLLGFLRMRVDDAADAEDLVQETMLRMVRSVKGLRSREHLKPWMFRIARGVLADHWKRRQRGHRYELASEALAISAGGSRDATNELAGGLRVFTSRWPERYREVLELSELQELPHREIAMRLGLSVSGVKSRVQRGRERLKLLVLACCSVDLYGGEVRSMEPKAGYAGTDQCGCG